MGELLDELFVQSTEACEPNQVKLELNHTCNLDCVHCYLDHTPPDMLSFEIIEHLLDQLLDMNGMLIAVTGGEPMLHPDFKKIVHAASSRGFVLELLTNATQIDEDMAGFLRKQRIKKVQVSVYGHDAKLHDSITLRPGSFDKTMRGIELMRKQGVKVQLACSLLKDNYKSMRKIRRLAGELGLGVDMSYWMMVTPANQERIEHHGMNPAEVEEYLTDLYSTEPFLLPEPASPEELEKRVCLAAVNNCRILPNGDVIPCSRILLPMGNIYKDDFEDIWRNAPVAKQLRNLRRKDLKTCAKCENFNICLICPGLSWNYNADLLSPADEVCYMVEADAKVRWKITKQREKQNEAN
jgi:radical SAM protein with 4Fe4S-binding SPASM domain